MKLREQKVDLSVRGLRQKKRVESTGLNESALKNRGASKRHEDGYHTQLE